MSAGGLGNGSMLETYILQELQVEAEGDTPTHTRAQGTHMYVLVPPLNLSLISMPKAAFRSCPKRLPNQIRKIFYEASVSRRFMT